MKKLLMGTVLSTALLLSACGEETETMDTGAPEETTAVAETKVEPETTETEVETVDTVEEVESEKEPEAELESQVTTEADASANEELHLAIMQENMSMYVDIEFDKTSKTFTMTPNNEELANEIALLASGIGFDEWDVLVNGLASMSETGVTSLGEGYSITLVNPHNEENILLWVMDGVVMYDVADDLR